jgi:hypothetical protein
MASATGCSSADADCIVSTVELVCADTAIGRKTPQNSARLAAAQRQRAAHQLHVAAPERGCGFRSWRIDMLETIAIILIVLWLLGVVSGYTMGNFIYILLVIAIVLFLVRLVSGRRVV